MFSGYKLLESYIIIQPIALIVHQAPYDAKNSASIFCGRPNQDGALCSCLYTCTI